MFISASQLQFLAGAANWWVQHGSEMMLTILE
jgi:hypothetical protein